MSFFGSRDLILGAIDSRVDERASKGWTSQSNLSDPQLPFQLGFVAHENRPTTFQSRTASPSVGLAGAEHRQDIRVGTAFWATKDTRHLPGLLTQPAPGYTFVYIYISLLSLSPLSRSLTSTSPFCSALSLPASVGTSCPHGHQQIPTHSAIGVRTDLWKLQKQLCNRLRQILVRSSTGFRRPPFLSVSAP